MKKYIKPSVEIIEVETQSILQASGGEELKIIYDKTTPTAYSSRRRNNDIWDDEEDEW